MKITAKLASLAVLALVIGSQTTVASNADQSTLAAGNYIVVFDNQANEQAEAAKLRGQGANIKFTYSSVFKGLAGTFNVAQISALQKNPRVSLIEADGVVSIDSVQPNPPSWGLDRIDQIDLPLSATYTYSNNGSGVNAYIIDTGILANHLDFGNRVKSGFTSISDGNGTTDCNGHGTHVAGTVGGTTYGVAKAVNLIPVRVLDCSGSGSWSGVINGIDWVAKNRILPAVANMSLGGGKLTTVNRAVAKLVSSGVIVSVAAGNSGSNACNYSPSSETTAITVGATDSSDSRASFSNFGTCLDIFAPGVDIKSDWIDLITSSTTFTKTISGTSMASPHVTGVAALYAQTNSSNPKNFESWLKGIASLNKVTSAGTGSPNLLLFTNL